MMVESAVVHYGECPKGFEPSLWHKCKASECKDYHLLSVSSLLKDKHSIEDVIQCLGVSSDEVFMLCTRSQQYCKFHVALSKWSEVCVPAVWGLLLPCLDKLESPELLQSIDGLLRQPQESRLQPYVVTIALPETSSSDAPQVMQTMSANQVVYPYCNSGHGSDGDSASSRHIVSIEEQSKNYERLVSGQASPTYVLDRSPPSVTKSVKIDMNNLQRSFASLLRKTFKACLEKHTSLAELRIFLNQRSSDEKNAILLFESAMMEIISHTSLEQTFLLMSRIGAWDFLNFRLVFEITEEFHLDEIHTEMQSYKGRVDVFKKKTRFVDFLHFWDGRSKEDSLPDCQAVIAKLQNDFPTTTLADVSRTEEDLTGAFKLKHYVFRLANGLSGSVYIMWLVPLSAATEMLRQMESSTPPNLAKFGIQELVIGRKIFNTTVPPQASKLGFQQMHLDSVTKSDAFWSAQARGYLRWDKQFDEVDASNMDEGIVRWFPGGKLNVSVNCLDRHVETQPNMVAIIWEQDEPNNHKNITYRALFEMTCKVANVLKDKGVAKGDRVIIYMPAMPLAAASMLACARIGAVHCVLYSSLDSKALGKRIVDTGAKVVITANVRVVGGKVIPLKPNVDKALLTFPHNVEHVLVASRIPTDADLCTQSRDVNLDQAMEQQPSECDPVSMNSDDDLFVIYTSGTTGHSAEPKGIIHTQAGYLLYAAFTHKFIFDHKPGDVFGCMADLGWIPSHTFVVYGPLCNGGTAVLFESIATYPDCWRYWETIERLRITQFYITPFVVKSLMIAQARCAKRLYDTSSLRIIAAAGEPLQTFVLDWYRSHLGTGKCTVLDTWWQTETGSVAMVTWHPPKDKKYKPPAHYPSESIFAFFGVEPVLLCKEGNKGHLCLKRTIPGMGKGIQSTQMEPVESFKKAYFIQHPGHYYTYDLAELDSMSHILGRVDDAVRIQGVWANVPHIESVMELVDKRVHETLLVEYQCSKKQLEDQPTQAATCAFVGVEKEFLNQEKEQKDLVGRMKAKLSSENLTPPEKFIFAESHCLPKTLTGKNIRPALKEIAQREFCDNDDSHYCLGLTNEEMKEYNKKYGHSNLATYSAVLINT